MINVECHNNVFRFQYLNHPKVVTEFISKLNNSLTNNYKDIVLDFSRVEKQFYPSVLVPLAGLIDKLKGDGISTTIQNFNHLWYENPFESELFSHKSSKSILNAIWRFNDENSYQYIDSLFEELEKSDTFPKGVLKLCEWSLNEVIDNVLIHSGVSDGFIMAQLHRKTKHIAFCVFDTGIGIQRSFNEGNKYRPTSQTDAIELAIQEGVTSNNLKGQGNGLFGLHSLVKHGDGRLTITSGDGCYHYTGQQPKTFQNLASYRKRNCHTCVDFVIDYSKELSIEKVLTFNSIDYKPVNLRLERMENERGDILFNLKDLGEGTGTRPAAQKLKNRILNILNEEPRNIILDFKDVEVISSSYADELIAKLLVSLGLFQFNQLIHLRNLDYDLQTILQRSVIQRFITAYSSI